MSNSLIPKQFQHITSHDLYSAPADSQLIKDVTLRQGDKTEFSEWDGYGVAYGFSNAREYSYTLRKLREKGAVGYVTNYYADLRFLNAGDRVYEELLKNKNLNVYLAESNPWQVEKTYAENVLKYQDPKQYEQLVKDRNLDKTYVQNIAVINDLNKRSGIERAFLVGNDNKSTTSGENEFQHHAKVTNVSLPDSQRFVRIDTAALSTALGGRLGFIGVGAMGIGRTEFFIQTNNPKLIKEADQYAAYVEQNKKPLQNDNQYFYGSKEPQHFQILKDIQHSTGDIFIHGATLDLIGDDPISQALVKARKEGRNVTVLSAGGRETVPTLVYLKQQGINVSLTNKYIPGTSISKNIGQLPLIKNALGGASEHSNVVIIKGIEGKDLSVTHFGSARLTGVFDHIKEGRPDTSVEGSVRLLSSDVSGLDNFLIRNLKRRYIISGSITSDYMFEKGSQRLYEPEFIRTSDSFSINRYTLPYRIPKDEDKDITKVITTTYMPNYSIRLPDVHFQMYGKNDSLPIVSTYEMLYKSRVKPPSETDSDRYKEVYESNLASLKEFDRAISRPTLGQYINLKIGRDIYKDTYGIGGSLFSYTGRQLDNLFGFDDMIAEREAMKRKKIIRTKQFINLHDKNPKDPEIGQMETIMNTVYQTASGIAISLGTYTTINLPVQHIRSKFEDVFTEQFFAPAKSAWYRRGFLNAIFFGGTLGMTVTEATTKVWSYDTKGFAVDAKGQYKHPTSNAQVGNTLAKMQVDILESKKILEDNLIKAAVNKGMPLNANLDHKGRLTNALEYLDDSEFNFVKDSTVLEIRAEKLEIANTQNAKGIADVTMRDINRSTSYLTAITSTSRDQLLDGKVVIGSTSEFFSYYGIVSAFRKYDTARFDLLLAPILRNINPYEFSTNPESAFGVYNASVEEFRRTLSQGIYIVYDTEAQKGKNQIRLANTGVQRNMELAKSLDRIGHLLPVNLFYWMPSVRKALGLPEFNNRENIVWADIFSIEHKTKQVEATLDYLGRTMGIRWHKIGPDTPKNPIKAGILRIGEGILSILKPIPTTIYNISRNVQLLAQQKVTDKAYARLEKNLIKPLYDTFNEIIAEDLNNFRGNLDDLEGTLKQIKDFNGFKSGEAITEAGDNLIDDINKFNQGSLIKRKGGLLQRLVTAIEDKILGSPVQVRSGEDGVIKIGADSQIRRRYMLGQGSEQTNQVLEDYLEQRAKLVRIKKDLIAIGFIDVQEPVNPLDKEANAGKRNLSLPHAPTDSKRAKLKMFKNTLGLAGTILLSDAAIDFAFLRSGVDIFKQIKARKVLSLRELQETQEGITDLDQLGRGIAHFKFHGDLGAVGTLATAGTIGLLGGILFPTEITPAPKHSLGNTFSSIEDDLDEIKRVIDELEVDADGEIKRLGLHERETAKSFFTGEDGVDNDINSKKRLRWDQVGLEEEIDSIKKFNAIKERLVMAMGKVNSIELNRLNYKFNKKTAWGGFILGLLTARIAGGIIGKVHEWGYSDDPSALNKVFKLVTGRSLNDRPELDSISSVLSSYYEEASGRLASNAVTVEDLAVAAALEYKAYSSLKVTQNTSMVYNIATQATLPFFQLAMIGRITEGERKITLGTAFQLNATLGLGISPILPVAIRLGDPEKTIEQEQELNAFNKRDFGDKYYGMRLSDKDIEHFKRQLIINTVTAGSQFVYEEDSNFEAAISFLGLTRVLGQIGDSMGYLYDRSNLGQNLKVSTATKSYTKWFDSMPVQVGKALVHGTTKHLVNLPVFFVDSSIRAARRSHAATGIGLAALVYFAGSSFGKEAHDSYFRSQLNLGVDDDIPPELLDSYRQAQQSIKLLTVAISIGAGWAGLHLATPVNPKSQLNKAPMGKLAIGLRRYGRSAGTIGLAAYTGFFISRLISDPATSFKGYKTSTQHNAHEATVGIGLTLTAGFLASGVFTSEESLIEAYKARLQSEPDYKSKLEYEFSKSINPKLVDSEFGQQIINNLVDEYHTTGKKSYGVRVKRMFMSTSTLRGMVAQRMFEQAQGDDSLKLIASSRYNLLSHRLGQAYSVYILTRLASLGIVSMLSSEDRQNLYDMPYVGESLKVLSGVGGAYNENTFKYNYQPSFFKTFVPAIFKILSGNVINLEPYQDKSDPFFNVIGSFGLSFKESGVSSYFQLASTAADLSFSSFNIAQAKLSELDLYKDILDFKNADPRQIYKVTRGRKARSTPMGFVPLNEGIREAIGGSIPLSTALDVRLFKQANLAFQRPDEIALDLYLEGLLSGKIAHDMFKDFPDNKLPNKFTSIDTLKDGKFYLGAPGDELMVNEEGEIVVRQRNKLIYRPPFIDSLAEDALIKDRLWRQSPGPLSFFNSTFFGLSDSIDKNDSVIANFFGYAAPILTYLSIGAAVFQTAKTSLYLSRRRETLELFEESYMSRATITGQSTRYQFKIVNYNERQLIAQIDLATGREGKVFGLAYLDDIPRDTNVKFQGDFGKELIDTLNTAHKELFNVLNTFFNSDINLNTQDLLKQVNEHYNKFDPKDRAGNKFLFKPDDKIALADTLEKALHSKLENVFKKNIRGTKLTVADLLYQIDELDLKDFISSVINNPNNSLIKSLSNNIIDVINQYSSIAARNPKFLEVVTNQVTSGKDFQLTQAIDMLRVSQAVNRAIDPKLNLHSSQLVYELTEPRLSQFEIDDAELREDTAKGKANYEQAQKRLRNQAQSLAENQGMYGKKVWGETFLSDVGNYGFNFLGGLLNSYLTVVQPAYELVEGVSIGLDKTKSIKERERGYTWGIRSGFYNLFSLGVALGVGKLGFGGIPAAVVGITAQLGLMALLQRDPTYAQREDKFFSGIADSFVPDDGSAGVHLTPFTKHVNRITKEVTGSMLAEIHGKEKSQLSTIMTNLILPQTQYLEEWYDKKLAVETYKDRIKSFLEIKTSPTSEYIHPELRGAPVSLIQEVRYHRYFKTNAYGGRTLSEFSTGAYRPSGLMMLALSRRQTIGEHYLGYSMLSNVQEESGRPDNEQGFRDLRNSILISSLVAIGGFSALKYSGVGFLLGGLADWTIGAFSGSIATSMFGPKYEAIRQASFMIDDIAALMGVKIGKKEGEVRRPVVVYGGPQAKTTYYEDGRIILSHQDAMNLASRRTSDPAGGTDMNLKTTIAHEFVHHLQYDRKGEDFKEDASVKFYATGEGAKDIELENYGFKIAQDITKTTDFETINKLSPLTYTEMSGKSIYNVLDAIAQGQIQSDSINSATAKKILNLTHKSVETAVLVAETQGNILDQNQIEIIKYNEVQAHFLAHQTIEHSSDRINELAKTPQARDVYDSDDELDTPTRSSGQPEVLKDRLTDVTEKGSYKGYSSPGYIVPNNEGFVSNEDVNLNRSMTVEDRIMPKGRELAEGEESIPFNRRYTSGGENRGFWGKLGDILSGKSSEYVYYSDDPVESNQSKIYRDLPTYEEIQAFDRETLLSKQDELLDERTRLEISRRSHPDRIGAIQNRIEWMENRLEVMESSSKLTQDSELNRGIHTETNQTPTDINNQSIKNQTTASPESTTTLKTPIEEPKNVYDNLKTQLKDLTVEIELSDLSNKKELRKQLDNIFDRVVDQYISDPSILINSQSSIIEEINVIRSYLGDTNNISASNTTDTSTIRNNPKISQNIESPSLYSSIYKKAWNTQVTSIISNKYVNTQILPSVKKPKMAQLITLFEAIQTDTQSKKLYDEVTFLISNKDNVINSLGTKQNPEQLYLEQLNKKLTQLDERINVLNKDLKLGLGSIGSNQVYEVLSLVPSIRQAQELFVSEILTDEQRLVFNSLSIEEQQRVFQRFMWSNEPSPILSDTDLLHGDSKLLSSTTNLNERKEQKLKSPSEELTTPKSPLETKAENIVSEDNKTPKTITQEDVARKRGSAEQLRTKAASTLHETLTNALRNSNKDLTSDKISSLIQDESFRTTLIDLSAKNTIYEQEVYTLNTLQNDLKTAQDKLKVETPEYSDLKTDKIIIETDIEDIKKRKASIPSEMAEIKKQIQQYGESSSEAAGLKKELKTLAQELSDIPSELDKQQKKLAQVNADLKPEENKRTQLENDIKAKEEQITKKKEEIKTITDDLSQTTKKVNEALSTKLEVETNITGVPRQVDPKTPDKVTITYDDVITIAETVKKAEDLTVDTNNLIKEFNKGQPTKLEPADSWDNTQSGYVPRAMNNTINNLPVDSTNYLKNFVGRLSEQLDKVATVDGPEFTINPLKAGYNAVQYGGRVASVIDDPYFNLGKTLVGVFGAFDLYTTYELKMDTDQKLRQLSLGVKSGNFKEEEVKLYLANLRAAERTSNLSTGTSLGISLVSNSFLLNFLPSIAIGFFGHRPKDNFEDYDEQIKERVERDLEIMLLDGKELNNFQALPSNNTFSLSATAKTYRENKVLTEIIDQNDIVRSTLFKWTGDSLGTAVGWSFNKAFGTRVGRIGSGLGVAYGFHKLMERDRAALIAKYEQLDDRTKRQYDSAEDYYKQHQNWFLRIGQWGGYGTAILDGLNIAWHLGAGGVEKLAAASSYVSGRLGGKQISKVGAVDPIDVSDTNTNKTTTSTSSRGGNKVEVGDEVGDGGKVEVGDEVGDKGASKTLPGAEELKVGQMGEVGDEVGEAGENATELNGQRVLKEGNWNRFKNWVGGLFKRKTTTPNATPKASKGWFKSMGKWWDRQVVYNTELTTQEISAGINRVGAVKGTADAKRSLFGWINRKAIQPIKTAIGNGFNRSINVLFPQLDEYMSQVGIRGSILNAIGPAFDLGAYLINSNEIGALRKDKSLPFEYATAYQESGRAIGSLSGSIIGMRSSGFVSDIILSFFYAEQVKEKFRELGHRRYKYAKYYEDREGIGTNLLQFELNLLSAREVRVAGQSGNTLNQGLGLALDVLRDTKEYEQYFGRRTLSSGLTVDELLHQTKVSNPNYNVKMGKFRLLGISGIVAKGDKERELLLNKMMGAQRVADMKAARETKKINIRQFVNVAQGKSQLEGIETTTEIITGLTKSKATLGLTKEALKMATVGDGLFKGFLGSTTIGTVIDLGLIGFSTHLENEASDIYEKNQTEDGFEAAYEMFESGQRLKSSSIFSLGGSIIGAFIGSSFGLKGMEVGGTAGGVIGSTFGDKIGQRTVEVAKDNKFTNFEAIGRGQNIGLGVGTVLSAAGIIAIAASATVTAPIWLIGLVAAGVITAGYTIGGHLPVFAEDGLTPEAIGQATLAAGNTIGQALWYTGEEAYNNTGRFINWSGKTIHAGAVGAVNIGRAIGPNFVRDFKKSISGEMPRGDLESTGRTRQSQIALQERLKREEQKKIEKQRRQGTASAKDNRNWLDKWLFPDASANELDDYLKAQKQVSNQPTVGDIPHSTQSKVNYTVSKSDDRNWLDKWLFPSASANELDDYLKVQKQATNQVTTVKQYLGQEDPYHSPTNSELLEADENTPEARRRRKWLDDFELFVKKSKGFFARLMDSKWFRGLAAFTAFVFSPVQMFFRFGRDFLKNPRQAMSTLWDRTTRTLSDWKDKIGSFWNRAKNALFGNDGAYHDPYAQERAHEHKIMGRLLKTIGIDYNAVPDVSKITTVGQLYQAFGPSMGWKSEKDAEVAVRMGISEYGSNAVTVATVFATTRNRQMLAEGGNCSIRGVCGDSVSWETIITAPGEYQVWADGSMKRVELNATNIQKAAKAAAIVSSGQLVSTLMKGEGIDRPLTQQEAQDIANSTAFSQPKALDSNWSMGRVTISAAGGGPAHTYAYNNAAKGDFIQQAQTKYPKPNLGGSGSNNQKPKGFNAIEFFGAVVDEVTFYGRDYNGPDFGGGYNLAGTMIVFPVAGKNRGDYKLLPSQTFSAPRGYRNGIHWGEDFGAKAGTSVIAMQSGVIEYITPNPGTGFGKVVLRFEVNGKTYYADYGHVRNVVVKEGQVVAAGQKLAEITTVGGQGSGVSSFEHLDMKLWTMENGKQVYIDPTGSGFWKNSINSKDLPKYAKSATATGQRLVRPFTADEESIIRKQFDSRRAPEFIKEAEARGYKKQAMATDLVNTTFKDPKSGKTIQLQEEAWVSFQQMQQAAKAEGIDIGILSGFRGLQQQAKLLEANAGKTNSQILDTQAPVGYSKHHTGMTVDVGTMAIGLIKEGSPEYNWLVANAARFGWQISYPKGNTQGAGFEAWEWSYVGGNQSAAPPSESGKLIKLNDSQIEAIKTNAQPGKAITPAMVDWTVYKLQAANRPQEEIDYYKQQIEIYNNNLSAEEKKRLEGIKNGTIKDPFADYTLRRGLKDVPNVSYPTSSVSETSGSSSSSNQNKLPIPDVPTIVPTIDMVQLPSANQLDPETLKRYEEYRANWKTEYPSNKTQPSLEWVIDYETMINTAWDNPSAALKMSSELAKKYPQDAAIFKANSEFYVKAIQLNNRVKDQLNRYSQSGNINYLEKAIKITEEFIKQNPNDAGAAQQKLEKLRSIYRSTDKPGLIRKILNIFGSKEKENVVASYADAVNKSSVVSNAHTVVNKVTEGQVKQTAVATDEEVEELVQNQQKEAELIKEIRVVTQEVVKATEDIKKNNNKAYKIEGASNVAEAPVDTQQTRIKQKPKVAIAKKEQYSNKKEIKIEISQPGQYVLDNINLVTNTPAVTDYSLMDNYA